MTNSKVMTMQWFVKVTTPPPFDHSTPEVLGITETWRFKKLTGSGPSSHSDGM